ncbi:hypothetical protein SLA_7542 [Streptomyces laurentii]|uniref:Uncharacterized protein n=1 Tax=Streptomyces laurentii TaxID=39478 RepID=A0A169PTZ0_STRLU|nr:hypothetical protein SLA_7542 [Streptomyces laurentii]
MFTMNTVPSQITMYSGDSDTGPARPGAAPRCTMADAHSPRARSGRPNDYATRAEYAATSPRLPLDRPRLPRTPLEAHVAGSPPSPARTAPGTSPWIRPRTG